MTSAVHPPFHHRGGAAVPGGDVLTRPRITVSGCCYSVKGAACGWAGVREEIITSHIVAVAAGRRC